MSFHHLLEVQELVLLKSYEILFSLYVAEVSTKLFSLATNSLQISINKYY